MECSAPPHLGSWPFASKKQKRDLDPVAQPELLQTAEGVIQRNSPLKYDLGPFGAASGLLLHPRRPDYFKDCMPWYSSGGLFINQIDPFLGPWLTNSVCVQSPYFVAACEHKETTVLRAAGNYAFAKSLLGCHSTNPFPGVFPPSTNWIDMLYVDVDILTYPGSEDANLSYYLVYFDEIYANNLRASGDNTLNLGPTFIPLYDKSNQDVLWSGDPPQCFAPYKSDEWVGQDFPGSPSAMVCSSCFRSRVVKEWHFSLRGSSKSTVTTEGTSTFTGGLVTTGSDLVEYLTVTDPLQPQVDVISTSSAGVVPNACGHRIRERVELNCRALIK